MGGSSLIDEFETTVLPYSRPVFALLIARVLSLQSELHTAEARGLINLPVHLTRRKIITVIVPQRRSVVAALCFVAAIEIILLIWLIGQDGIQWLGVLGPIPVQRLCPAWHLSFL